MKKLVAIAVAGAFIAPLASAAELGISGDMEYVVKAEGENQTFTTGDADFKFSVSEQLTDGLKLDYALHNKQGAGGTHLLGLSGDFGKITIGTDNGGTHNDYDEVANMSEQGGFGDIASGTSENGAFNYHGTAGPVSFGVGYTIQNPTTGVESEEAISLGLQYNMGPLKLGYGVIDVENQDNNPSVLSVSGSFNGIGAGYEYISNDGGVDENTTQKVGLKYAYGNGNLFAEQGKKKTATTSENNTAVGVSYKVGSMNTYLVVEDSDAHNADTKTYVGLEYAF